MGNGSRGLQQHSYRLCDRDVPFLFTENETNQARLFGLANPSPYVKDGINDVVVHGKREGVSPEQTGTKAAAHYEVTVAPGDAQVIRLRLSEHAWPSLGDPVGQ